MRTRNTVNRTFHIFKTPIFKTNSIYNAIGIFGIMSEADSSQDENGNMSRNVLSFGCELEFLVAYVMGDEPDPDADNADLAPILRVPGHLDSRYIPGHIFEHINNTLRAVGLTLQDRDLPLPPDVDESRARAMFGISVKEDGTLHEGDIDKTWNGYRFYGVEVNSSASWTSTIAFQELELLTQVLLHNYRIRVNQSCGLQFHIGNGLRPLNTQTVKRVAALLWCLDPISCHIHPPQRRRGPFSLPIREHSNLARGNQTYSVDGNETFFKEGRIGKPNLGGSGPIAPSQPARVRRFPSSRLSTSRAAPGPHEELEKMYPDGFGNRELEAIPDKDVDSALDGVWRCLACQKTDDIPNLLNVLGGPGYKPNYSFSGYEADMNPEDQDEWWWEADPDLKLTIEFREAVGSMDAQWITSWGRICAAIVLFAQNSSTIDLFDMLMRLAQAQGDFGDAGAAPYDFIDFLDDIGCFAEAELLEGRLQDKKLFWFPCRKLDIAVAVGEQDPHRQGPPRGWRTGFGNENDQTSPNQATSAEDLWPTEEPAESAAEVLGEEYDTTVSAENSLTDHTRTESAGPEQADATAFERQSSSPIDEMDAPASGANNPTEFPLDNPIRHERPTEEEQKTASQETEAMKQEEKARAAAAEREATDRETREEYTRRFPHGYERIPVSAHGLLCGLRALSESIMAQEPERLCPCPMIEELQQLLKENPLLQDPDFNEISKLDEGEINNFRADQLAGLLQVWGRTLDPPWNLGLGFVRPQQPDYIYSGPPDGNQIIIWVFNDNAQSESEGILGHYEGLRPRVEPVVVLADVDRAEQQAIEDSLKSNPNAAQGGGAI